MVARGPIKGTRAVRALAVLHTAPIAGRHEPYESRGSRADLWGPEGEIPSGYPAVIGQERICRDFDQHFRLTEHGDRIRLDIDLSRRIINVGPKKALYEPEVWIDEWCEDVSSDIDLVEVFSGTKRVRTLTSHDDIIRNGYEVKVKLRAIELAPNEDVREHWQAHEIKRRNGSYTQTMRYPVSNPTVQVDTCEGVDAKVDFAHHGIYAELGDRWILQGTLLPKQMIMMRWWDTEAAAASKASVGSADRDRSPQICGSVDDRR